MRKIIIFFALLLPSAALGQGVPSPPGTAFGTVNGTTRPIANATVTVCAANASGIPCAPVPLNTIYANSALTIALPNPFNADVNANYQFFALPGQYTVTVTSALVPGFSGSSYQVSLSAAGNTIVVFSGVPTGVCTTSQIALDSTTGFLYGCNPPNWVPQGGGTNILPMNNTFTGTNAFSNNTSFAGTNLFSGPNLLQGNACFGGPSPWIDVTCPAFGARAVNAIPQTTATMTAGSSLVLLASAIPLLNGDWVVIRQAGSSTIISVPPAPTVTPVAAAGAIGANRNANLSATGNTTTYNYCLRAITPIEGVTGCGFSGSTTTGAATLGAQTVTITSSTRTNNQLAIVMSAPIQTAVNGILFLAGTSDATMNNVWCRVNTWTDNEHFTCLQGLDTRAGATTAAASGGTATSYVGNKLTFTCPAGAYQCALFGRTGSTLNFISFILPGQTTFTDFGSPFMDNQAIPDWMPATSVGSALAGDCSGQVLSGAGTMSIRLVNPCTNAVTGATIKFDDGPPIQQASLVSVASGTSGTLNIPAAAVSGNGFYPINSHISLSCGNIQQNAIVEIYSTVDVANGGCTWKGTGGSTLITPQFAWTNGPLIEVQTAYPGINFNGGSTVLDRLVIQNSTAGVGVEFNGSSTFSDTFSNVAFVVNGNTFSVPDYVGLGLIMFGSSQVVFDHVFTAVSGDGSLSAGATIAPLLLFADKGANSSGDIILSSFYMATRGVAFDDLTSINNFVQFRNSYCQGCVTPFTEFEGENASVTFDGFTNDTTVQPFLADWNSTINLIVRNNSTLSSSGVTGDPLTSIEFDTNTALSITGQNIGVFKVGVGGVRNPVFNPYTGVNQALYNSPDFVLRGPLHFPTGEVFFDLKPAAPVSAAASSGGSLLTAGNWTFEMTVTDQLSGESAPSAPSNTCTTSGSNLICALTGTAVQGAVAYSFYATNSGGYESLTGCRNLTTPTCNAGFSGALDGATTPPTANSAGLTGMISNEVFSPNFVVIGNLSGSVSFRSTIQGTFTANHVLTVPDVTDTICTLTTCVGGGGANVNLSNLVSATSINQDLIPLTAGGKNLGSSSTPWGTLFVNTLQVGNTTGGGTLNVGTAGGSAAGILQAHSSIATNNTAPGCLGLFTSPSDTLKVFLNPSAEGGFFVTTGACASADSTNILSPVGIPNYQSGTTYTILTSDRGNKVVFQSSASAATTWTMPLASNAQGASFPPGFKFQVVNQSPTFSIRFNATSPNTFINSSGTPSSITVAANSAVEIQVDQSANLAVISGGASGAVTNVTGTSPIVSSGGTTPAISCPTCSTLAPSGSLGSIQLYATATTLAAGTNFDYQISSNVFDLPSAVTMLFHDTSGSTLINDGVGNLNYSGNFGAAGLTTNGTGAGADYFTNGTAPSFSIANTVYFYAPTTITTSYGIALPGAAATGLGLYTNSSGAVAMSFLTSTHAGDIIVGNGTTWPILAGNSSGTNCLQENSSGVASWASCGSGGGVTSLTGDGNIITNSASTGAVTLAIAGTSGGGVYFSSSSAWKSTALLTLNGILLGGGAGQPYTSTAALTNGQLCIGSTSAACVPATLTSGSNVTITNSAGGITIASSGGGSGPGASIFNITSATTDTGTSATSMLGGAQTIASGNFITTSPININVGGIFSVPTAYTGTVTVAVFIDGTQIATTGALSIPSTAVTNGTWAANCQLTTYTTGSSGTYAFGCPFMLLPSSTATITLNGGSLAISGTTMINTTTSHTFDLKWTWSTATGSPTVTGQWGSAFVGGSITVGGSNTQLLYNNSGAIGGISDFTTNGTTTLTGTSGAILDLSAATTFKTPVSAGAAPTAQGTHAYDSTLNSPVIGETEGGSSSTGTAYLTRGFPACVGLGPSAVLSASTSAQIFTVTKCVIPANYFVAGKTIVIEMGVQFVSPATTDARTYQLQFDKNGAGSTLVGIYTTSAMIPTASATRGSGFRILLTCVTTGSTGTFNAVVVGSMDAGTSTSAAGNNQNTMPVTFDTTSSQTIELSDTFNAATSGNTDQAMVMSVTEQN